MLWLSKIQLSTWRKTEQSSRGPKGDESPCLICGRGIKRGTKALWVHLHDGGSSIVTEAEAAERNAKGEAGGDMGAYPIGPDCYRRNRDALAPYVAA
jgi:hypothetical protein